MRARGPALLTVTLLVSAAAAHAAVTQWGAPRMVGKLPAGGFPSFFAVADFNADGREDALFTRTTYTGTQTFAVTVLAGDGGGNFADATSTVFSGPPPAVQVPRELVVADFNGDARPDVFIADHGQDAEPYGGFQNTLILSAAGGKLVDATANLPQQSDFTHSATAGDIDADGDLDLYLGNLPAGPGVAPPEILLNDGTGHFTIASGALPPAQTDMSVNSYTASLFVDVNGDKKLDLVLGGDNHGDFGPPPQSVVLLGDGAGHFAELPNALPAKPFAANAIPLDIATTDLNGDGNADLLIAWTKASPFYVGRWLQALIGKGDGTFTDETAARLPQSDNSDPWPTFFQPRDIDGDGIADLGVLVNAGAVPMFLRDPQGVFHPLAAPPATADRYWAWIDAEGDGANDILTLDRSYGTVALVPDVVTNPPPVVPPSSPPAGTTAPSLSRLRVNPKAFRAARSGPSVARAPAGTTVSYTASEAVTATFRVERVVRGVKTKRGCVGARTRHRHAKRCTRFVPLRGRFTHSSAAAGATKLHFSGRVRGKRLRPAAYRLVLNAQDGGGYRGNTLTATFRIVSR